MLRVLRTGLARSGIKPTELPDRDRAISGVTRSNPPSGVRRVG
jgi:hypothetical protein